MFFKNRLGTAAGGRNFRVKKFITGSFSGLPLPDALNRFQPVCVWVALSVLLWVFAPGTAQAQEQTILFSVTDPGVTRAITNWGVDTGATTYDDVYRSLFFMGTNTVNMVQVAFTMDEPLTNNDISPSDKPYLTNMINLAAMTSTNARWVMSSGTGAGVNSYYISGANTVYPNLWAATMEAWQRDFSVFFTNRTMLMAQPFNEPDYGPWNQGSEQNLYSIMQDLQASTKFAGVYMGGGCTFNCDDAVGWYDSIASLPSTIGTTHCLNGSVAGYESFIQTVLANNAMPFDPEMHNLGEAIIGANYGLQGGIWWLTAELARGSFVNACQGQQLGYEENDDDWTAAAVYRGTNGVVQAFLGGSERMGLPTTYRFFSRDRDVFYNGNGPQRAYTVDFPGTNDTEEVLNINWGADVQPPISGRYIIVNRFSQKVLEVPNASTNYGTILDQNVYSGASNQLWDVYPLAPSYGGDLSYYTMAAAHDGETADESNGSYSEGNPIQQWGTGGDSYEHWYFQYAGNGYFYIRNRWSGLYLDVPSTVTGAEIVQWGGGTLLSEQWRLIPVGNPVTFITPAVPTGLNATANAVSVQLSWNTNSGSTPVTYTVLQATNSVGPYDIIARGLTNNAFTDNSANQLQTYYYEVKAEDGSLNTSGNSAQVSATPTLVPAIAAQYNFDGNTSDSSGNANDAITGGSPAYVAGEYGPAISLDGTNQYIMPPAGMMAGVTNFTFAAWVNWNGGAEWQRIFDFGNGTSQYMFLTPDSGSATLRFAVTTNGSGAEQRVETSEMPAGQWVHVAVTYNGSTASLYTNGVLAASGDVTICPADFNPALNYLGQSQYPADPFLNGQLGDVLVANYAMSAAQVTALFALAPVANLVATVISSNQVDLSWSPVLSATNYNVKRSTTSGGPYTTIGSTTATNYIDGTVTNGLTYYYVVSALSASGESTNSAEVGANTAISYGANAFIWEGGNDSSSLWSTVGNWLGVTSASPGSGNVAVFNGPGNGNTLVSLGSGVIVSNVLFDTTNVAAYTIGSGAAGSQTLTLNSGGGVTMNPTVGNNQLFNANLALSGSATLADNSMSNAMTIAGAVSDGTAGTLTVTGSGNTTISGNINPAATLGLSKAGNGTLTLAARSTYSGPTTVSAGTLDVSGTVSNTAITTVGGAAGNSVLINGGTLAQLVLLVGNANGAIGAVFQTNGTVSAATATTFDNASIGNIAGGFGYYDAIGGTFTSDGIAVGGENNTGSGFSGTGGNGIMDINGGTVNDTGWLVLARGVTNETGILNVFSGALDYAGGGVANCWGSGQTAIINLMGGAVDNTTAVGFNLNLSGNTTNTAILNLNGGIAQANSVSGAAAQVNFNGGTLQASAANSSFMTGLGSVNLYGGGATIDDNGYSIGVSQSLLAPTGNGVNGVASFTGGAGYIAPPIVTVVRGAGDMTGMGAAVIAQIDISTGNPTSGQVTNVLITCPGVNYTAMPTFTLSGGGATTPATITSQTPTANSSGGFTKTGSGTLTLSGVDTYTGNTTIARGTLKLLSSSAPVPAPLLYLSFDDVSGGTVINQGTGGTAMNGTLTGTATIVSGGINGGNALSIPSGTANAAYVLITNPVVAMTGTASWTIGMWVKTTTAGGVYAYQGSGGWVSGNMTFYLNEGSDNGYGTKAGGVSWGQGWEEGSTAANDGNWHFLVMTCNGSTKAMYVDGNVDTIQSSWASATGVGSQLWIGGSADTGDEDVGLGGLIDGVCMYNYALSQAQVRTLYSSNPAGPSVLPVTTAVSVASGATLDVGGVSQTIGSLVGPGGSSVILADVTNATGILTVGNASNMIFAGTLSGTGSLTKAGTGILTLSGANTYSGNTVVSNGTLAVNNTSGSATGTGNVTVQSGGTMSGAGTLAGLVTVAAGGTFAPGNPLGTLTVKSNLTLASGSTTLVQVEHLPLTNSAVEVTGTLNYGGTLIVTNSGVSLLAGDTFQIFSATGYTGTFAVTNLPPLGNNLYWTNTLAANGSLAVVSSVSTVPTNIVWSVSGTNLMLSWPTDHIGWQLQAQTNSLNAGLGTNWVDISGSSSTNDMIVPLNPAWGSAFYRLIYQ